MEGAFQDSLKEVALTSVARRWLGGFGSSVGGCGWGLTGEEL